MTMLQSLMLWPERPLPSLLLLLVILMPFLYVARESMQLLIARVARAIEKPLRLGARWMSDTALRLRTRNREVLFSQGGREAKLAIEREFERVTVLVQRDLEGYPALQRRLMDEVSRIEDDYRKSGEVPPPPPEWVKAIEAIAKIKANGDGVVDRILFDIRKSLDDIYRRVIGEYRRSYEQRHKILKSFLPFWRSVQQTLGQVERNVTSLQDSAQKIDTSVARLESIVARSDAAENSLTSSASTQFFVAALVILIAL
ncbi:MAG TPA: hypothetical protein VMP00_07330, partial [Burkholderiales bacterium]|nr:hypothetical protein [Burkholderiales bacterium]